MKRPRILRRADMLKKVRRPRPREDRRFKPRLHVSQVLEWAKRHHRETGAWPNRSSGEVIGVPFQTWYAVEKAFQGGYRGLPKGLTIVRVLAKHLGVRNSKCPPKLTIREILEWADEHKARTGDWPRNSAGPILGATGETWGAVAGSLSSGSRGLPRGWSLTTLLYHFRGARNKRRPPKLTIRQILEWADRHKARTGDWPHQSSGAIPDAPGENWRTLFSTLSTGCRGLPKGWTVLTLLQRFRGARNKMRPPRLSIARILGWADAHHARTGFWPTSNSGEIPGSGGEHWARIDGDLKVGLRGLRRSTLQRVLHVYRGVRLFHSPRRLSERLVLRWADAHRRRTGSWPTHASGRIPSAKGESWLAINAALGRGNRGLRGGSSLARLLERKRGVRNRRHPPPLTFATVLRWAEEHRARTGRWPGVGSGLIPNSGGETWCAVFLAFHRGGRGVKRGSLPKLLRGGGVGVRRKVKKKPRTGD